MQTDTRLYAIVWRGYNSKDRSCIVRARSVKEALEFATKQYGDLGAKRHQQVDRITQAESDAARCEKWNAAQEFLFEGIQ